MNLDVAMAIPFRIAAKPRMRIKHDEHYGMASARIYRINRIDFRGRHFYSGSRTCLARAVRHRPCWARPARPAAQSSEPRVKKTDTSWGRPSAAPRPLQLLAIVAPQSWQQFKV